jgi:hypothetical protein
MDDMTVQANTQAMNILSVRLEKLSDDLSVLNRVLLGDQQTGIDGLLVEHRALRRVVLGDVESGKTGLLEEHRQLMTAWGLAIKAIKVLPRFGLGALFMWVLAGNDPGLILDVLGGLLR